MKDDEKTMKNDEGYLKIVPSRSGLTETIEIFVLVLSSMNWM